MIDQAFYVHKYARTPALLASALEVYLRERLAASTYARVAVRDGRAVGILMGQVAGQPWLKGRVSHRLSVAAHTAKIVLTGFRERAGLLQSFFFQDAYRQMHAQALRAGPLTDELTLFAVDASARGLGIGSRLYRDYLDHLRAHGRSDFYLYTDSLCTYQFYERQGMSRAAEREITLHLRDEPEPVGVYLYTGNARTSQP